MGKGRACLSCGIFETMSTDLVFNNDSVCLTFSSKFRRLFHPGPVFGMGLVFFLTIVGLCVLKSTFFPFRKLFAIANIFFYLLLSLYILKSYAMAVWCGPGFVKLGWKPVSWVLQIYYSIYFLRIIQRMNPTCNFVPFARVSNPLGLTIVGLVVDAYSKWITTVLGLIVVLDTLIMVIFSTSSSRHLLDACIAASCARIVFTMLSQEYAISLLVPNF